MVSGFSYRYLVPPGTWVQCALESQELMRICLKRLRGLNRVHLVDAGFVWTEPHSKRIKVKLTVQKEVHSLFILVKSTKYCGRVHQFLPLIFIFQ